MKELEEPLKKLIPDVEINQEIEKQKHYKLIGSMVVRRGHKLYAVRYDEYNRPLGVYLAAIEIPTAKLNLDGTVTGKRRVFYAPNTFYTSALNPANALKHYLKVLEQFKNRKP